MRSVKTIINLLQEIVYLLHESNVLQRVQIGSIEEDEAQKRLKEQRKRYNAAVS